MSPPGYAVALAVLPLLVLALLVLRTRLSLAAGAWLAAGVGLALSLWPFRLETIGVAAGAAKGAWTGAWILAIVLPALLLYEVAERSGALGRLAGTLEQVAPTPGRRLLLGAWVLPSFLQGAAGFGTPIAVAAPLLVRTGMAPVAAVSACLVGYHWAITFGSMGSAFFVAAGTARLTAAATAEFAVRAAALLVVNCVAAGLLVLRRTTSGGVREAVVPALALGALMSAVLVGTVLLQPALGSTVAGLAGLLACWWVLPRQGRRPDASGLITAAGPYLVLTVAVTVGFLVPGVTDLGPAVTPSFPASEAAFGHANPPLAEHQPFRPLGHPALYVLTAAAAGWVIYRAAGWWHDGAGRVVLDGWVRRSLPTAGSVLGLTVLSGLMVEAGMIVAIADWLAGAFGLAYAAVAAVVGLIGTVLSGSTTASNALLAPLQARAAEGIGLPPALLLAAQAAGGNVGNMLSPANILVGAVAAGCAARVGDIVRQTWSPALVLLVLIVAGVAVQAALPTA